MMLVLCLLTAPTLETGKGRAKISGMEKKIAGGLHIMP
jgi:hypothetical protein